MIVLHFFACSPYRPQRLTGHVVGAGHILLSIAHMNVSETAWDSGDIMVRVRRGVPNEYYRFHIIVVQANTGNSQVGGNY